MEVRGVLLVAIEALWDARLDVSGFSAFQKRMYFLEEWLNRHKGWRPGFDFLAGYYGPQSTRITSEMGTMVWAGWLSEEHRRRLEDDGFECVERVYRLSERGKTAARWWRKHRLAQDVRDAVAVQGRAGAMDYVALSIAAEVWWRCGKQADLNLLRAEAHGLKWRGADAYRVGRALAFLRAIGFATDDNPMVNKKSDTE